MPFTLSHPAAVLPLLRGGDARGPLIASALVAGAMAPDVPFFADSLLPGVYGCGGPTHRWWAVPTLDVAIAAALVAGWHGLVRAPLVGLLPDRRAAVADALTAPVGKPGAAARAGWFALSAAIGAATHVGWDAFTHHGRGGVRAFPALNRPVGGVPLYTVLQYGTSILGLACLTGHVVRLTAPGEAGLQEPARRPGPRARRAAVAGLVVATAGGVAHRLARRERNLIPEACFGGGAGLALGAAAYGAAGRFVRSGADHDRG